MSSEDSEHEAPRRPLLRVVRGNPDDEELAALTAVVAGMAHGSAGVADRPRRRSRWADPAHQLRVPPRPGPGAWRACALPR